MMLIASTVNEIRLRPSRRQPPHSEMHVFTLTPSQIHKCCDWYVRLGKIVNIACCCLNLYLLFRVDTVRFDSPSESVELTITCVVMLAVAALRPPATDAVEVAVTTM
jgi:hypothetical protein